jgi:hypothetical protein
MKTLVVFPGPRICEDILYYLIDMDTGECLASHLSSNSYYAIKDLHDRRPERMKEWEEKFCDKTEAKFITETSYSLHEIYMKVNNYKKGSF